LRPDRIALAALLLLAAAPVAAQGLEGRTVLFRIELWEDPAVPLLESRDYMAVVGDGPEFGVEREGNGLASVVPVRVDLGPDRIDLSYGEGGVFGEAAFNGYVLTFPAACALLLGAAIDREATTLPLRDADLLLEPQALRLHVGGLSYAAGDRIGIMLRVADCPVA
jgi:hypothetical protein